MTKEELIETLDLKPHPEGGYYRELYRSQELVSKQALPDRFGDARHFCTSIYYLLHDEHFSAFHRIKSDEIWHHYSGETLSVHVIHPDGRYEEIRLGKDVHDGEQFQAVVPAGAWFASEISKHKGYTLAGCTVSPGFDFADFEMAEISSLLNQFPEHKELIGRLTRG